MFFLKTKSFIDAKKDNLVILQTTKGLKLSYAKFVDDLAKTIIKDNLTQKDLFSSFKMKGGNKNR